MAYDDLTGLDAPKLLEDMNNKEKVPLTPKKIAQDLRSDFGSIERQVDQLTEQLTITDAILDQYDDLIIKVDNKIFSPQDFTAEINAAIDAVSNAYKARIAAGCRNDLAWVLVEQDKLWNKAFGGQVDVSVYECKKDPATRVQQNYYGVKYYKRPKDRDYGANVVDQIRNGTIDALTTVLVLFDENAGDFVGLASTDGVVWSAPQGRNTGVSSIITIGDFITDDLDDPKIFTTGNLPTVVGLGTTSYPAERVSVSGFTTSGESRFYGDNQTGILTTYSIGDFIYADGVFPNGTTITGFGTALSTQTIIDEVGVTTSIEIDIDYATTSQPSIATTSGHILQVGIVSTYPAVFLSTFTQVGGANTGFTIVRPPEIGGITFDESKNPIDPVEIGMLASGKVGFGNKIALVNNGDSPSTKSWHEVREEPQPGVGAGYIEHWEGNLLWPTLETTSISGYAGSTAIYSTSINYATEGQRVTVNSGSGSTASSKIGTTGVSPLSPSNCAELDAAIASAESNRDAIISANTPKINYYCGVTQSLRDLRDEKQTQAWSFLQGIGSLNAKKAEDTARAEQMENIDWSEFE